MPPSKLRGSCASGLKNIQTVFRPLLPSYSKGLQDPVLASEVATALHICSQYRSNMAEHFTELLQILEQIDKFNLKPEAANGLIKGVVILIFIMNQKQLKGEADKNCVLQVTLLNSIKSNLSATTPKIVKYSMPDPVLYLDRPSAAAA